VPTTARGIWTPSDTDAVDFTTHLATMAGTIDTAITNGLNTIGAGANAFKDTAAQRTAFLSTAVNGMLWQDTDSIKMIWRKDGAAWVPAVWRWSGTTVQMNGFSAPDGFEWFNTTDNSDYVRLGGEWKPRGTKSIGGFVNITVPVGTTLSTPISFPTGLFSAAPGVALGNDLTYSSSLVSYIRPTGVSVNGFTISSYKDSGSPSSARVGWVASGP